MEADDRTSEQPNSSNQLKASITGETGQNQGRQGRTERQKDSISGERRRHYSLWFINDTVTEFKKEVRLKKQQKRCLLISQCQAAVNTPQLQTSDVLLKNKTLEKM